LLIFILSFELFLLADGEKKIEEKPFAGKPLHSALSTENPLTFV
jgi:hypothetical protein